VPVNPATLYPLLRPTARATRWVPLAVGAALGLALVLVPQALTTRLTDTALTDLVRIAATCLALGAAFLLDDPATRSIPTVPTSRLTRNLIRVLLAVPAMAVWWAVTLGLTREMAHHPAAGNLPAGALTLEAATLVVAALALAATIQRRNSDGNTGVITAPAVLVLTAVIWFLPARVAIVVAPGDPHWTAAHHRWAAVLVAALIAFLWSSHEGVGRPIRPAVLTGQRP
jgi:hypothetical protein